MSRLQHVLRQPDTISPSQVAALQRTAGNRAVQRLFGLGKKSSKPKTPKTKPVKPTRTGPQTERERFNAATFKKEDFRPSTTIGKFDVLYRPSTGVLQVISKVHFTFKDVEPSYYDVMADKKERKWTSAGKKEWTRNWVESVLTKWGEIAPFTCVKPGFEDVVVQPRVEIKVVDSPAKAHYALSVDKAFRKKEGGMRAGGTSGVTREFRGGFQEQDAYDKINNPKVAQHLAQSENKGNVIPAYNRDRERLAKTLADVPAVTFKPDSQDFATGTAANATRAAQAVVGLRQYSALSELHPVNVNLVLGHDEPPSLTLDRFGVVKQVLEGGGVKNTVSAKDGGADPTPYSTGTGKFEAAPDTDEVKEQYLARWDRYTSAHEFGHMMGLLDEYCPAVSPELIAKMVSEGQIGVGEKELSDASKAKAENFKGPQTGYTKLLEKTGQRAQAWTRPGAGVSGEKSTSLMSGGFEMLRQHHVTIWEALTSVTKDYVPEQDWKM